MRQTASIKRRQTLVLVCMGREHTIVTLVIQDVPLIQGRDKIASVPSPAWMDEEMVGHAAQLV